MADFELEACVRNRAQRVKNPSKRTPDRETAFNNADSIERQLQEDDHKIWGWVIYRCTYKSDEERAQFMDRLRYYVKSTLQFDSTLDMQRSLDYRVFEDRELFEGAHPSVIREHFSQWAVNAPQEEQGEGKFAMRSQRYNYCLHVDGDALQSVINGPAPPADNLGDGYVNLVCLKIPGGMRPEHTCGRDENDHCWLRVLYQRLMASWYNQFRPQGSWGNEYRVPPEVAKY